MARTPLTVEQILSVLDETPKHLAALTVDLTPQQLRTAPGPGEWSANEVLAHLRSCADVWGECISRMLAEEHPTLRAIDPRTWTERTDYLELEFGTSLHAFTSQRAELLAVLEPLPAESWTRTATVTGAGAPLVRTVHAYARRMSRHERPHIKQVARIIESLPAS
jgi:hypothetical protein